MSNNQKFIDIATRRTNAVLQALRVLESTAQPSLYKYTPEQVAAIFTAIDARLAEVKDSFQKGRRKAAPGFAIPAAAPTSWGGEVPCEPEKKPRPPRTFEEALSVATGEQKEEPDAPPHEGSDVPKFLQPVAKG